MLLCKSVLPAFRIEGSKLFPLSGQMLLMKHYNYMTAICFTHKHTTALHRAKPLLAQTQRGSKATAQEVTEIQSSHRPPAGQESITENTDF